MNKQLIITYFEEFKHWLNGGKILYALYDLDDKNYSAWYELHHDCKWDHNNAYRFKFIINDEYVEFRKAMAEGKTIQYYVDGFVGWQDVKSLNQSCMHPTSFRIKPEEPKFKVGDWLIEIHGGGYAKVLEVIKKDLLRVNLYDSNAIITTESTDFILWQPKPGELVILKDKNCIISIIKYNGETDVYPFIGEITWLHKKD